MLPEKKLSMPKESCAAVVKENDKNEEKEKEKESGSKGILKQPAKKEIKPKGILKTEQNHNNTNMEVRGILKTTSSQSASKPPKPLKSALKTAPRSNDNCKPTVKSILKVENHNVNHSDSDSFSSSSGEEEQSTSTDYSVANNGQSIPAPVVAFTKVPVPSPNLKPKSVKRRLSASSIKEKDK